MPSLLRKVVIFAAVDGLILQSAGNGLRFNANNESSSICIDYKTNRISSISGPASDLAEKKEPAGLETYGFVGLLTVASYSFLLAITQRQQVAQIQGKPIYTIANVAVIPTSSHADASRAISQAKESILQGEENDDSDTDSEDSDVSDAETDGGDTDVNTAPASPIRKTPNSRTDSISGNITENMMGKRLRFGRFAANWLSRKAMGLPGLGTAELNPDTETLGIPLVEFKEDGDNVAARSASTANNEESAELGSEGVPQKENDIEPPTTTKPIELLPKLLRYTKLIFSSRNFFFSYDYDLTKPVSAQAPASNGHLPLHKITDELYFWNRNLMTPFVTAGAHPFVLPLIQGFVGQSEFTVAAKSNSPSSETELSEERILGEKQEAEATQTAGEKGNFLLTLISRRSVKRPGLRYLRRGVDDDGNTANSVETEQILSVPDWDSSRNVYSYLQIRGSIPLYFSQSPYSFKPIPILHHSSETNRFAFERHFRNLSRRYGKVQCVSLVDKRAPEIKVGEQYEKYAQELNQSGGIDGVSLGFEWFDFHNECRGMRFENVSRLVDRLEDTLGEFKNTVVNNGTVLQNQTGIVRTNCMDCLDRTGVAQCAFGQLALERELKEEGIDIDLGGDSSTSWFNILWADNGDAISKQYSSTAALKGDYTRTRKRDYRGALNDFGLTLSRYYNNIVNDFFSQACIDYLLGNVSTQVFQEFATELQTADPGISVQKLRQNAIDTSCRIVISDPSEEFLGGWTMLTPRQPNTLRTLPFEESVLLLTDAAVYSCRFDWNIDKVLSFERIDLRSITRIIYGTYITSTLTDAQADEQRNVGLVVEFREGDNNALRVNTRSLQSNVDPKALDNEWDVTSWFKGSQRPKSRVMAFKALPLSNSVTQTQRRKSVVTVRENDWVRSICEEIERAMRAGEKAETDESQSSVIEPSEIISLTDAKKRTGLLEHLVHDIKKMVWA
ncbi:SacI homology domain-containing protein [Aspergillus cavernicola]|uniref:SacI homology domain-containing protein n=1 Tax=Aspergillus cavernicola TaxID=176166 RepID=A0ABR4I5W0_9EURO